MVMSTTVWSKTIGLTNYEKPLKIAASIPGDLESIFTMDTMNTSQKKYYHYTGFGAPEQITELQLVEAQDAYELSDYTITAIKFAMMFILSEELEDDNTQIPDLLTSFGNSMGDGHRYVRELTRAAIFNNAFSSSHTKWDGYSLCNDSHSTNDGTTIDNNYTATSIEWDPIWDQLRYFQYSIYDEAGLPADDEPAWLLTHPANQETLEAIFKSPGKFDSTDRHANTLAGKVTPVYSRLLSSTTAYFMLGRKMKSHLIFSQRKPVTVAWKEAFQNIGRFCRSHQRFACDATDYRFIIGSQGA